MRILFLPLLVLAACFLHTTSSYEINPSLKFSEAIHTIPIGKHFENLAANHPLFTGIALGTLPLDQFKAFTQQDDLYVRNYFAVFRTMAERETHPERKQFFTKIGADNWDSYFKTYYDKFNFTAPTYMVPRVVEYSSYQLHAAKNWDLSAALATTVPCYTVWSKLGVIINQKAKYANITNHPYQEFLDANSPSDYNKGMLKEFLHIVDGYYAQLGAENQTQKQREMFDAYLKSVENEYFFAETTYALQPENTTAAAPKFTDIAETINERIQKKVLNHRLYKSIGSGTLPFDSFKMFIQQDHIYVKGFFKAFEIMEAKETDPKLKKLLKKDGTWYFGFFNQTYEEFNFAEAEEALSSTADYVKNMISVAQNGSIGEGLAAIYPNYLIWNRIGVYMNGLSDLPNNSGHPYRSLISSADPTNSTSLANFSSLINGYFERLNSTDVEMQHRMYQTVQKSLLHEYLFATEIYERGVLSNMN